MFSFTIKKIKAHGIQSHHFMANRWGKCRRTDRFYLLGFQKIAVNGECSHEVKKTKQQQQKKHLLLGRKAMTNLDSALKSKCNSLLTKVHLVKGMVFPVGMYGYESWTIKRAEHRTDAFEMWFWRRLVRDPWTAKRSNQSILKEINLKYLFEGLMLKLKLQYFGHLMQKADSLEKTPVLRNIEGNRRRGQERRQLDSIANSMDMNLRKLQEIMKDRGAWHAAVYGVPKSWT